MSRKKLSRLYNHYVDPDALHLPQLLQAVHQWLDDRGIHNECHAPEGRLASPAHILVYLYRGPPSLELLVNSDGNLVVRSGWRPSETDQVLEACDPGFFTKLRERLRLASK